VPPLLTLSSDIISDKRILEGGRFEVVVPYSSAYDSS